MKIAYIVPGSGGSFYCGNCLRDSAFIQELRKEKLDVTIIPMYLPLAIDDQSIVQNTPIFFGAVNIYLKQLSPLFKKMPKWLVNYFDSMSVLKYAARKAGSTRSKGMEPLTISMLKGEHGNQADDLVTLINFLKDEIKPDVVHISNALLLGLAPKMKNELGTAVVCSLQDEDGWINDMKEPYRQEAIDLINENAKSVDAFVSVSDYYQQVIREMFDIPANKMQTIYNGIDLGTYRQNHILPENPTIGFISRMNSIHGLDDLVDAFILLKKKSQYKNLKLKITGGSTSDDSRFIKKMMKRLKRNNVIGDVEINDDYIGPKRHDFLNSLTLFCAPVKHELAFGIYLIEALASGLPVVQPKIGAFEEIVTKTGAGVLYEPVTAEKLAESLDRVLSDKATFNQLKENAVKNTGTYFDIINQVKLMYGLYRKVAEKAEK
jgi:glycosyltransferase involved in cell wall biosynthesis